MAKALMPKHEIDLLAEQLKAELDLYAKELGPRLLGTTQPDAHRVDREEYLKFVRASWWNGFAGTPGVEYRNQLLGQIGPEQFAALAEEAWVGTGHDEEYHQGLAASMFPPPTPMVPPTGPMPAPPPVMTQPPPPMMAPPDPPLPPPEQPPMPQGLPPSMMPTDGPPPFA